TYYDKAREVVELVWTSNPKLSVNEFISRHKYRMVDEHLPVIDVGIRCIDIIDYDYPYWHTLQDTPDKCSAESLGKVGRVVVDVLYR
ncbi:MAG: M28 family peptidase, partial [candidate division KSB1 bacterium]|nr:M28 family peptidase [candidate division KSB1 bacterium]